MRFERCAILALYSTGCALQVYFFDAVHPHKPAPPALKGPLDSGAAHSNSQVGAVFREAWGGRHIRGFIRAHFNAVLHGQCCSHTGTGD